MSIKVYSDTERFRRTRNGAWVSAGWDDAQAADVPEERAFARAFNTSLSGITTLEWPDGHRERFSHNSSLSLTGPADSRLLPEACRRPRGTWYLHSRAVYTPDGERVEVPPYKEHRS